MAIIGISGKIGSGKDTIGKIIQWLTTRKVENHISEQGEKTFNLYCNSLAIRRSQWTIVKFADTVKDIVCLLIGCTREQLEDEEFKNRELGSEWWVYQFKHVGTIIDTVPYTKDNNYNGIYCQPEDYDLVKLTPRKLLTLIGTDMGRVIHPNIWINTVMRDYKSYIDAPDGVIPDYWESNWIITDVRFPNELKAIEDRGGFVIRVNRIDSLFKSVAHESEIALDNHKFKYTIKNNDTIDELIDKVKEILVKEDII